MEITQAQYDALRELTQKTEQILNEISGIENADDEDRRYWSKRIGTLAKVMLDGGIVDKKRWIEIAKEQGYDARGSAGFYVSSMTVIADDKRAITERGKRDVLSWLRNEWESKPFDDDLKRFKSLIERN